MLLKRLVDTLARHGIEYALVGGYAVALHGAVRGTVDIDLIIDIDIDSLTRTEKALNVIGLQSRLPITPEELFQFRDEYIRNRNLKAWSFVNPSDPTEMVDIVITDDLKGKKTVTRMLGETKVTVLGLSDLINMKKRSGRPQDLEDVAALEKIV